MAVVLCSAPALADTVLVGTGGSNATDTGLVKSYTVTSSGTVWTANSPFNTDAIGAPQVVGLGQDIYGNVYVSGSNGIFMYRQTGGANIGRLTATMGSGNLTGNGFEGLTIGTDGKLVGAIPFGTGNNKIISFDTATLVSGSVQTGQAGTQLSISGSLNTPRGMTVASDGNLYIANRGAGNVLRWNGSTTGTAFSFSTAQGIAWDAANNRFLVSANNLSGVAGAGVGTATLSGSTSPNAISSGSNNWVAVMPIEGTVASVNYGSGTASALTGTVVVGGTAVVSSLGNPQALLNVRDTRIWSGGNGSWSTAGSWTQGLGGASGTATFTSGTGADPLPSILTFTGAAGGTATNDVSGSVFVGGINFAPGAGAYTLSGSAFTLGANANIRNLTTTGTQTIASNVAVAGSQWIYADTGATLAMTGAVSGSGTVLTKVGPGVLRLSGSNSYTGGTTISAGTLNVGNQFALGSTAAALAVNGGTLDLGGNSVSVGALSGASGTITTANTSGTATLTTTVGSAGSSYAGTISNNGSGIVGLTKAGVGNLTLSGNAANTYTGLTTVSGGALTLGKSSGNAFGGDLSINNASVLWSGTGNTDLIPDTASVTITGSNSFFNTKTTDGTINTLGISETFANLTMDGGSFWVGGNTSSVWNITGTGSFTGGSGQTQFGNSSGGRISFGALQLTNMTGTAIGTANSFGVNGGNTTSVTVGAGGLTLNNSNVVLRIQSTGARLVLNGPLTSTGGSSSAVVADTSGQTTGTVAIELSGTTGNVTRTLTIGGGGADFTSFVPITNGSATTAGITKAGVGRMTLTQGNSYNGATTINSGTLLFDPSLVATATATTISNLLVSSGTITIGDGSTLAFTGRANQAASTLTSGSYNQTGSVYTVASTAGLTPGAVISGSGIAAGTYVQRILSGTQFAASAAISSGTFTGQSITVSAANFTTDQSIAGIALSSGTGTVSLTNAGQGTVLTVTGAVTGNGALLKAGNGRLVFSSSNSYSGATTISAGTLALGASGSFDSSPTITIGDAGSSGAVLDLTAKSSGFTFLSGQTVKGIGTIQMASGKSLTINGTLAAGNSPGTLTVAGGDLVLGGSSITSYEISGTNNTVGGGINDLTTVSGSLTLGGTLNVIASPAFDVFGNRTYRVFNYATSGTGSLAGSMTIGTTPDANYLYSLNTATSGQVNLFVQRKADQATTFSLTPTASRVLAGGSTTLSGGLANTSPTGAASLAWSPTTTGSLSGISSSLGETITAGGTSTISATILAGNTAGVQSWSIVNTSASAITTTSTATGSITVFDPARPSFTAVSATTSWLVDVGSFTQNTGTHSANFTIYNLLADPTYTADLRLISVVPQGSPSASLGINLTPEAFGDLAANNSSGWLATLLTTSTGSFTNTYELNFVSAKEGASLGGPQAMTLIVTGVIIVPEPGAIALAGIGIAAVTWRLSRRQCRHSP